VLRSNGSFFLLYLEEITVQIKICSFPFAILFSIPRSSVKKAVPVQALSVPGVWDPKIHDNRHKNVVKLSALRTGRPPPYKIFMVLISIDHRA
jgi:hypothetical protein